MPRRRNGIGIFVLAALAQAVGCGSAPADDGAHGWRNGTVALAAAVPGGCAAYADCASCVADATCGWCGGSCTEGGGQGPDGTSSIVPYCATTWAWQAGDCTPTASPAAQRSVCQFGPGASPDATLENVTPPGGGLRDKINYIFVIVQENHSMDNMFAFTFVADINGLQPASHPAGSLPAWTNSAFALTTSCPADQGHQWFEMHDVEWHRGACDGFPSNGSNTMGFYQDDDHPFYTYLATNFATTDSYFGSVLGGTWPNRQYLYMGTSDGVDTTLQPSPPCQATGGLSCTPHQTAQGGVRVTRTTIFDQLDAAGVPWKYTVKNPLPSSSGLSSIMEGSLGWNTADTPGNAGIVDFNAVMQSIQNPANTATPWNGPLPNVVFIDGGDNFDEHPASDLHQGERLVHDITQTIASSSIWSQSAIFITYDEAGGYFDHVVPPNACPPDPTQNPAPSAGPNAQNPRARNFDYLGFRVPLFVVSPYGKAGVSHVTHSHTSILRFIQARYGLPALTGRDANSDALLDMFDWSAPLLTPPPIADAWAGPNCATVANLP